MLSSRTSPSDGLYPKLNIGARLWLVPFVLVLGIIVGTTVARGWIYCVAFCLLCLLLLWPVEVGLGAYVLFLPFEPISVIGDQSTGTSITWVLGILAGMAVLGTMIVRGRFRRPPKSVLWWSLLVLWATVSTAWAMDPDIALKRLPTIFSLFLLFLICACTRFEQRELNVVALLSIAGGCAAAIYTCFLAPGAAGGIATLRNSLAWGDRQADPNGFAESLLVPLALSMGGFVLLRNRHARAIMLVAFGLISYAVLLTMSRGALVALLVMTIVYVWNMPQKLSRRLLIPAAFLGVAVLMMLNAIVARFALAIQTGGAGRLDIWTAGFHAIKEHGLIGAGLDNFPLAYSEVAGYASEFRGIARAAHNIFLNIWVELGVPGLLLFVTAMAYQLRVGKRALRAKIDQFSAPILMCQATCWSVLTAGLFLDIVWRKTFWLSWTLLMLAVQMRRNQAEAV
jgi:O-antigen ligase